MKVIFKRKSFTDECDDIADMIYEEYFGRVQTYIGNFFGFDLDYLYRVGKEEGKKRIAGILEKEYENCGDEVCERIREISGQWNQIAEEIFGIMEKIFECRMDKERMITAEFTVNVVCQRFLDAWKFDINYRKTDSEIILTCIHEILHFFWFEKWSAVFPDADREEYEAGIVWLFSEIAVDALCKETELKKYCITAKPAYQYFYDILINNSNMMEYFRKLYGQGNIVDFMKNGIEFIREQERFILG